MESWRVIGSRSFSLPLRPVAAATGLRIALTQSLDQRSPQRFVVVLELSQTLSMSAISSMRGVIRPCGSPTRKIVCRSPPSATFRLTWPGRSSSTAMVLAIQPMTLPHPTTEAMRSSLMEFCKETQNPSAARYWAIIWVCQTVS